MLLVRFFLFIILILTFLGFSECVGTTSSGTAHSGCLINYATTMWYVTFIIGSASFLTGSCLLYFYAPKALAILSTWLYCCPPVVTVETMYDYIDRLDNFGRDISVFNFEDIPFETVIGMWNVQGMMPSQMLAFDAFTRGYTAHVFYAFPDASPAYFALSRIPTFTHWGELVHFMERYHYFEPGIATYLAAGRSDVFYLTRVLENMG